jgi:hypothetical protein
MEMGKKVELRIRDQKAVIELFQDQAPLSCEKIWRLLPIRGPLCHAKFAGDELMFMIPAVMEPEFFKETIETGDVLYYPVQQTICLFYGKNIVPFGAGPFNAIGRITEGLANLAQLAKLITQKGFQWAQLSKGPTF